MSARYSLVVESDLNLALGLIQEGAPQTGVDMARGLLWDKGDGGISFDDFDAICDLAKPPWLP